MKLKHTSILVIITVLSVISSTLWAQTIDIGTDTGTPGNSVAVPVMLDAYTYMMAALVRIEYDPMVLENPSVTAGLLLTENHTYDYYTPEVGRLNVVAYPKSGVPVFAAKAGTLFFLNFDIKVGAPPGESSITFTNKGTPDLPSSDLTHAKGTVFSHTTNPGSVMVGPTRTNDSWTLYR